MIANIVNANTRTVAQAVSPMPTVRTVLNGWLRDLELTKIVKLVEGSRTEERKVPLPAQGTWQPFGPEQLKIKPEGERSWRWFMIHTTIDVVLLTDDVIARDGVNYRVMEKGDYSDNGVVEYHVVNDADSRGGGR